MKEHNYALQNADKTFEGISLLATLKFEYKYSLCYVIHVLFCKVGRKIYVLLSRSPLLF